MLNASKNSACFVMLASAFFLFGVTRATRENSTWPKLTRAPDSSPSLLYALKEHEDQDLQRTVLLRKVEASSSEAFPPVKEIPEGRFARVDVLNATQGNFEISRRSRLLVRKRPRQTDRQSAHNIEAEADRLRELNLVERCFNCSETQATDQSNSGWRHLVRMIFGGRDPSSPCPLLLLAPYCCGGDLYTNLNHMADGHKKERHSSSARTMRAWKLDAFENSGAFVVPEPFLSCILLGVARGVAHLHRLTVAHRDLKPENVFLSTELLPLVKRLMTVDGPSETRHRHVQSAQTHTASFGRRQQPGLKAGVPKTKALARNRESSLNLPRSAMSLEALLCHPNTPLTAVVGDLGLASGVGATEFRLPDSEQEGFRGTLQYMSPEQVKRGCRMPPMPNYGTRCDSWAVGLIALDMMCWGHLTSQRREQVKLTPYQEQMRVHLGQVDMHVSQLTPEKIDCWRDTLRAFLKQHGRKECFGGKMSTTFEEQVGRSGWGRSLFGPDGLLAQDQFKRRDCSALEESLISTNPHAADLHGSSRPVVQLGPMTSDLQHLSEYRQQPSEDHIGCASGCNVLSRSPKAARLDSPPVDRTIDHDQRVSATVASALSASSPDRSHYRQEISEVEFLQQRPSTRELLALGREQASFERATVYERGPDEMLFDHGSSSEPKTAKDYLLVPEKMQSAASSPGLGLLLAPQSDPRAPIRRRPPTQGIVPAHEEETRPSLVVRRDFVGPSVSRTIPRQGDVRAQQTLVRDRSLPVVGVRSRRPQMLGSSPITSNIGGRSQPFLGASRTDVGWKNSG